MRNRTALLTTATLLGGMVAVLLPASPALAAPRTVAYVTEAPAGTDGFVSVVDTATKRMIARVRVGLLPWDAAATPDGSNIYVTSNAEGTVTRIRTSTNTVGAIIPVGKGPRGLAISPDGSRLYVANQRSDTMSVIDTATDRVVKTIAAGSDPQDLTVTPDGRTVLIADTESESLLVYDPATNATSQIPGVHGPAGIAVTPDGARGYATSLRDNAVTVLDTVHGTVVRSVPTGNRPTGIAVSPNGTRAYVANNQSGTLSVLDTAAGTVLSTVALEAGIGLLALSPDGSRLYLPNPSPGVVTVVDTVTGTVTDRLTGFDNPQGVVLADVNLPPAVLEVRVTGSADTVTVGDDITYTITATNKGPDVAENVHARIEISDRPHTIGAVTTSRGTCQPFGVIGTRCQIGDLPADATAVITITVTVTQPFARTLVAAAGITTSPHHPAINTARGRLATPITPIPADPGVDILDSADPVTVGRNYTYTATVTNDGPGPSDFLTARFDVSGAPHTIVSATTAQGRCVITTGITCEIPSLAKDARHTVVITVRPEAAGTITATVTAAEADPATGNNTATVTTTVTDNCTILGTTGNDSVPGTSEADAICTGSGSLSVDGQHKRTYSPLRAHTDDRRAPRNVLGRDAVASLIVV